MFPYGVSRIFVRPLQGTLRSYSGGVQTNELRCSTENKINKNELSSNSNGRHEHISTSCSCEC